MVVVLALEIKKTVQVYWRKTLNSNLISKIFLKLSINMPNFFVHLRHVMLGKLCDLLHLLFGTVVGLFIRVGQVGKGGSQRVYAERANFLKLGKLHARDIVRELKNTFLYFNYFVSNLY